MHAGQHGFIFSSTLRWLRSLRDIILIRLLFPFHRPTRFRAVRRSRFHAFFFRHGTPPRPPQHPLNDCRERPLTVHAFPSPLVPHFLSFVPDANYGQSADAFNLFEEVETCWSAIRSPPRTISVVQPRPLFLAAHAIPDRDSLRLFFSFTSAEGLVRLIHPADCFEAVTPPSLLFCSRLAHVGRPTVPFEVDDPQAFRRTGREPDVLPFPVRLDVLADFVETALLFPPFLGVFSGPSSLHLGCFFLKKLPHRAGLNLSFFLELTRVMFPLFLKGPCQMFQLVRSLFPPQFAFFSFGPVRQVEHPLYGRCCLRQQVLPFPFVSGL